MWDTKRMLKTAKSDSEKLPYQKPVLRLFGTVKALTATGTGPSDEGASGPGCPSVTHKPNSNCPSDRSLKENVVCVGNHPLGIGLYLFNFKPAYRSTCGLGRQFGVMADEVGRVMPEAVHVHPDGYKMVDYDMLGISRALPI